MEPILYFFGKKNLGGFFVHRLERPFFSFPPMIMVMMLVVHNIVSLQLHVRPSFRFFLDSTENNIVCLMLFLNIISFFAFPCLSFIPPGLLLRLPLLLLIFSFFFFRRFLRIILECRRYFLLICLEQSAKICFFFFPMTTMMMTSYLNELYSNGNVVFDGQRILVQEEIYMAANLNYLLEIKQGNNIK